MSLAGNRYDTFSDRLARRSRRLAGFAVVGWLIWTGWALYDAAVDDGAFFPLEREGWLYVSWAVGICVVALVDDWLVTRRSGNGAR